jgi:hypothetical protein
VRGTRLTLAGLLFVTGCGVNIETGQTPEEAEQSSEVRAKGVRSEWSNRFESVSTVEKAAMLQTFVDSVSATYFRFGRNIADQWREGNEGRGTDVSAEEMQKMVDNWTAADQPVLQSYEDVVEYGLRRIRETAFFPEATQELIKESVDQFYDVYSAVFYPSDNVRQYESRLDELRFETERISRRVNEEIDRFR